MMETDLAANVVRWLEAMGWDVYQEVEGPGGRADIVALRAPLSWVIECKMRLGFDVIEQAVSHMHHANMVSVATPPRRRDGFARQVLERFGVGHLLVPEAVDYGAPYKSIREEVAPRLCRHVTESGDFRKRCRPEHKTHAKAGTSAGGQFTPFKRTAADVRHFVEMRPGCTLKELFDSVETHYASRASARAHFAHWVREGKVPGVEMREEGKRLRFFPAGWQGPLPSDDPLAVALRVFPTADVRRKTLHSSAPHRDAAGNGAGASEDRLSAATSRRGAS